MLQDILWRGSFAIKSVHFTQLLQNVFIDSRKDLFYSEGGFTLLACFFVLLLSLRSVPGVDADADLPLQLLEGHLGALALRARPPAVDVDRRAPGERNRGRRNVEGNFSAILSE